MDNQRRRGSSAQVAKAVRVMTVFLEHGGGPELQDELLVIDEEDDGVSGLLFGLIQLNQRVLYTLASASGITQREALERLAWFEAAHGEGLIDLESGEDPPRP